MCLNCWSGHLEITWTPPSPDSLARYLGLPFPPLAPRTQRPMVADDQLVSRGRNDGVAARVFNCDRCHRLFQESAEVHGTFLYDRPNGHIWSFDCVRVVVSSTGAAWGLSAPAASTTNRR